MRTDEPGGLQSVSNALAVLEILARQGAASGVAEVARQLDLPRSTTYRLLNTLERHGFVEQDQDSRKYRLGLKLFELAGAVWGSLGLGEIALPFLEQLARDTEETTHLAVADRGEALVIEKVDSPREIYFRSYIGARRPLHCTAIGKALLAFWPEERREALLAQGLRRFTLATVTDPDRLRAELAEIRRRGYALNWGEYHEEAAGVSAPVRDRRGSVVAAVGVAAPIGRLPPPRAEGVASQVLACASAISRRLGWHEMAARAPSLPGL
ncbi:MAG TPA: IclR family transcriptional regulator [Chloroflexota bacterium]|nr:IclR family transcriptional regulator [Chloroflexota bacterium]